MTYQTRLRACDNSSATGRSHRVGVLAMLTAFLAVGLTLAGISTPETAEAATVTFQQCDDILNADAAEVNCDVTITNTIDNTTGITSSIVATTVCTGAPGSVTCVSTPATSSSDVINRVEQCNGSANAGGSRVTCNVTVVNNITGDGSTTPATVNQCIGSGTGGGTEPTINCAPMSSTTDADITQCNGSGNNGGASERVRCTVNTSTTSSLWPVEVYQCNGTANGGGDLVTCTAQISSFILPAAPASSAPATTTPGAATTVAAGVTVPAAPVPTDSVDRNIPTTSFVFTPTDITLPATGTGSLVTQSGVGFAVMLIGVAALLFARRRQPA